MTATETVSAQCVGGPLAGRYLTVTKGLKGVTVPIASNVRAVPHDALEFEYDIAGFLRVKRPPIQYGVYALIEDAYFSGRWWLTWQENPA